MTDNINNSALYRRLLGYAWPYRLYFIVSFFGFILFSSMEAAMVQMVEYFIKGLETREAQYLLYIPVAIIVIRLIHGVGGFLGNFFIARVGVNVVADLRKELFSSLVYLPNRYYDEHNSGELVSLLIYNIQQVTGSVTNAVKTAIREGMTALALLCLMLYHNWLLTLIFMVVAPILGWLVSVASRHFRRISRRMQTTMGGITHIANEALQGFRLVRSYGGQPYEIKRFNGTTDENTRLATKYERVAALQGPVFHLVIAVALAVILTLILFMWDDNAGAAIAYLTAAGAITRPLRQLSAVNETIQKGLAAAETIFAVIDMDPEEDTGKQTLLVTDGRIQFENVSFAYNNESIPLKSLNLTLEPGQTVAIVGRSGSGKSTITNLLLRFYPLDKGRILIDGQNITDVTLSSLRQQIALVNQQTILFNDSVANNIAYGFDNADRERVREAARHANALEFIEALPEGFDTMVGEDGARLSGGQRQRLAVARAIFKNSPILILDEATSALDNESEKAIQAALETLQKGRTTLVIAHRLSTIEKADQIIVLEEGEIVEAGKHEELLAHNRHYAKLYQAQFSES